MTKVKTLVKKIGDIDAFQKKYLESCVNALTEVELADFEKQLEYLFDKYSLEKCVTGYMTMIKVEREERKYFFKTGHYRYSTVAETQKYVYSDPIYMDSYMLGLQISAYLLNMNLTTHRWFKQKIKDFVGGGI